ncbi:TonB C-terminal domain-containing protein [Hydrogenimonas sp.]
MGRERRYFYIGALAAVAFYLLLLLLLILFFNDYKRSKRYVPKKSQNIEVAIVMQSSKKPEPKRRAQKERKRKVKAPAVKKPAPAAPKTSTPAEPKAISSLFKGIKADRPVESGSAARLANAPKIRYKASAETESKKRVEASRLVRDINLSRPQIDITSKSSGIGEVDEYMSRLYDRIYRSWQPEAIYAGEEAKVRLHIAPDGSFDYSLLFPSDNQGFNQSLIEYLDRLKREKLPPHKRGETLDVDIEFKAKE